MLTDKISHSKVLLPALPAADKHLFWRGLWSDTGKSSACIKLEYLEAELLYLLWYEYAFYSNPDLPD
jgi:hypothetical protein